MEITEEEIPYEKLLKLYNRQTKELATVVKQSDRQVKELMELNERLEEASIVDLLTGAFNRKYLFDASKQLISLSKREKLGLTVALIDIDHLNSVNDTYGNSIGDMVIKDLSDQISNILRTSDLFARFSGQVFTLLLSNTTNDKAMIVTDKLRKAIELSCPIFDMKYTVSIGLAQIIESDDDIDSAIQRSELALREAKNTGRNKVVSYNNIKDNKED